MNGNGQFEKRKMLGGQIILGLIFLLIGVFVMLILMTGWHIDFADFCYFFVILFGMILIVYWVISKR